MKMTLEFTLPDEQHEYDTLMKATEYASALCDIYNMCRDQLKHGKYEGNEDELITKIKEIASEAM